VVIGDAQGHWLAHLCRIPRTPGARAPAAGAPWTTTADHPRIVDSGRWAHLDRQRARATDDHQLQLIAGRGAARCRSISGRGARSAMICCIAGQGIPRHAAYPAMTASTCSLAALMRTLLCQAVLDTGARLRRIAPCARRKSGSSSAEARQARCGRRCAVTIARQQRGWNAARGACIPARMRARRRMFHSRAVGAS